MSNDNTKNEEHMRQITNLHEHQRRAVTMLCGSEHCMMWMDPGLGKTFVSLAKMREQEAGIRHLKPDMKTALDAYRRAVRKENRHV